MRRLEKRRYVPVAATTLLASCLTASLLVVGSGQAASAGASRSRGGVLRTRVTARPIAGSATSRTITAAEAAPSRLPSRKRQIQVLSAVLKKMEDNYSNSTPGAPDILDYGIGALWRKGIDGAGTTIAVIEGWNFPGIAKVVASFDRPYGLPNPDIRTIYPNGKLPAKCPPGMVKLGSYGSCSAWQGELALDVVTAHLIAPTPRS